MHHYHRSDGRDFNGSVPIRLVALVAAHRRNMWERLPLALLVMRVFDNEFHAGDSNDTTNGAPLQV